MERTKLMSTRLFFIAILLVLPILYIPIQHTAFLVPQKYLLLSIVVTLLSLYLLYKRYRERDSEITLGLPILGIIGATTVSTILSYDSLLSFVGDSFSVYAWTSIFLLCMCAIGVRVLTPSIEDVKRISIGVVCITSVISTYHALRVLIGRHFLSFDIFDFVTQNTIGESSDLAIYASMGVFVSLYVARVSAGWIKYLAIYGVFANLALLTFFNFNVVSGVPYFYIVTACMFVYTISIPRKRILPSLCVALFLVLSIFSNTVSRQVVSVGDFVVGENTSIQVSVPASFEVIKSVYGDVFGQMLLGVGPNTYPMIWARYKPVALKESVNLTEYWDYDFRESFSNVLTHVTTGGLIILLAWILMFAYVGKVAYKALLSEDDVQLVFSVLTILFWSLLLLYTPGLVHVVLAFVFLSMTIVLSKNTDSHWLNYSYKLRNVSYVLFAVFVTVTSLYITTKTIYAYAGAIYADKALLEVEKIHQGTNPDLKTSVSLLEKAIAKNPLDEYKRFLVDLRLYMIENKMDVDMNTLDAEAIRLIGEKGDSVNFRNWIQFGRVQELKTMLGSTTTAPIAYTAYVAASNLAPTHPLPLYMLARVHVYAGNLSLADRELRKALLLKPNYREALSLYNEIHATSSKSSGKMGK